MSKPSGCVKGSIGRIEPRCPNEVPSAEADRLPSITEDSNESTTDGDSVRSDSFSSDDLGELPCPRAEQEASERDSFSDCPRSSHGLPGLQLAVRIALRCHTTMHDEGRCVPCYFNLMHVGCARGAACHFCHHIDHAKERAQKSYYQKRILRVLESPDLSPQMKLRACHRIWEHSFRLDRRIALESDLQPQLLQQACVQSVLVIHL